MDQPPIGLAPSRFFPPAQSASEDGLLGFGGQLTTDWLLDAYVHGIFPWPLGDIQEMAWWSLDPRAIIELEHFHVPRCLQRTCRRGPYRVTCDQDFQGVIRGCATAGDRRGHTWITPRLMRAYVGLHQQGHAHSIEVWRDQRLAGGTYGVAMGGLFAAESKFHYQRDASKVALVHLVAHLRARGYRLLDIQQLTPHSVQFGAVEIPREEYLRRLAEALPAPVTFGRQLEG